MTAKIIQFPLHRRQRLGPERELLAQVVANRSGCSLERARGAVALAFAQNDTKARR